MDQILESQLTPHISPSWVSYGVSIVRILEKIDHVIMALCCILNETEPEWHIYQGVQRSGKSQGNSRLGKSQGKVREFCEGSWLDTLCIASVNRLFIQSNLSSVDSKPLSETIQLIVSWTPRSKLQCSSKHNGSIFLTLNVWGLSYLGLTRSLSWLLMPWRRKEQPWYWQCRISRFLSCLRKDFNYLRRINMEKWHKM